MAGVENARAVFSTKPVSRRIPRLIAFGLAASVVAVLPFAMRTPAVATMTLAEVRSAAEAAQRMHSRWYSVSDGKDTGLTMEQWQDGDRFRHDLFQTGVAGREIQHAFDGTRGWSRFSDRRYISVTSKPAFKGNATLFIQKMFEAPSQAERKKLPPREVEVDGKRMWEISLDSFMWDRGKYVPATRSVWIVDPEGKRPYAVRGYKRRGGEWHQTSRASFEYPAAPLDATLFQLKPQKGEKLFDKDEEARTLPDLWAKGLGSRSVAGETITLRDVVLDREGIAGVIWTGGGRFQKGKDVTITDRTGKKWMGRPYLAYTRSPLNKIPESRLTKIEGKPNRMVLIYGVHGVVSAPLRVDVPVIDANGKQVGTASFQVPQLRATDQLFDLPDRMGISEKGVSAARAIQR